MSDLMEETREDRFRFYLEPTALDARWGLNPRGVGYYRARRGDIGPDGRIAPFHIVVLIVDGAGTFWWDRETAVTVGNGTLIRVSRDIWHRYAPDPDVGWSQYWTIFDGDYADTLAERGLLGPPRSCRALPDVAPVVDRFERMIGIARDQEVMERPDGANVLRVSLMELLFESEKALRAPHLSSAAPAVASVLEYIRSNWRESLDYGRLATSLGVSQSHLRRLFRRETGMSPTAYQQAFRINKAKELLESGRHTVSEVARAVGIHDPYYFSRLFRSRTGMPPSRWRAI